MRKNKFLLLVLLLFSFLVSVAAFNIANVNAASDYYSSISNSSYGSTLKSELRSLITSTHTKITSYDDCKNPSIVKKTDGNASNSKIVLFWSELEIAATWDGGTTWNREHVWPQSKGWFTTSGAGADLHHIRPSDPSVNSSHNNYPYGEVSSSTYVKTSKANGTVYTDAKCSGGYFEPGDNKKGDTARIIFYLLVRYSQSDSYSITNVAKSMDMLLEWNDLDPVDSYETRRNEAVYNIQGNRNPFIDNPDYADYIWGNEKPGDNTGSGSGSGSESGGEIDTPVTNVSSALSLFQSYSTKTSLALDYDYSTYVSATSGSYSYTFTSKVWSSATAKTLNGVVWDPETTSMTSANKYYGYDGTKGQQFGSANSPFEEVIIKTTDNILDGVTKVTIQASGASGTDATVSAYVGTSKIGTTKSLTNSNATYTFTSSTGLRGNVKFVIKQTTKKAIYVKGMSMTYSGEASYVDSYSLNSASMRFGAYITKDLYDILNNQETKWGIEYTAGSITNWASANPKTMYCTPAQVDSPNATTTSATGNYYQWSLKVTNLTYTHLDKTISARAFVEYEGVRYYMSSASYSLRSLVNAYLSNNTSEFASHIAILNHLKNY